MLQECLGMQPMLPCDVRCTEYVIRLAAHACIDDMVHLAAGTLRSRC